MRGTGADGVPIPLTTAREVEHRMQLEHEFVVPVPVAQAWDVLLDVELVLTS